MTDDPAQRMRAIEDIFVHAAATAERADYASFDPLEIVYRSAAPRDGSTLFAPLGALLIAELDAWERIGLQIGYFVGERPFQTAVAQSDVLKVYFARMSAAQDDPNSPASSEEFQDSLVNALEDLRPERLELVDLVLVASEDEANARLAALREVATQVRDEGVGDIERPDDYSWALSGRESAIEGWAGPAGWRSNPALDSHLRLVDVNSAGAALALAVLLDTVESESIGDAYAVFYAETGEGDVAQA